MCAYCGSTVYSVSITVYNRWHTYNVMTPSLFSLSLSVASSHSLFLVVFVLQALVTAMVLVHLPAWYPVVRPSRHIYMTYHVGPQPAERCMRPTTYISDVSFCTHNAPNSRTSQGLQMVPPKTCFMPSIAHPLRILLNIAFCALHLLQSAVHFFTSPSCDALQTAQSLPASSLQATYNVPTT